MSRYGISTRPDNVVGSEAQIIWEHNINKVRSLKLVIHFDTKIVNQYTREEGISTSNERLSISVSSLESGLLDFPLSILKIESFKGSDQDIVFQSTKSD